MRRGEGGDEEQGRGGIGGIWAVMSHRILVRSAPPPPPRPPMGCDEPPEIGTLCPPSPQSSRPPFPSGAPLSARGWTSSLWSHC